MLQNLKWKVPTTKYCKDSWNGSFQLQDAANSKKMGRKADPKKMSKTAKKNKGMPDPMGPPGLTKQKKLGFRDVDLP